jgi:hypothetical protein
VHDESVVVASSKEIRRKQAGFQFSLGTMLLVMTLVAACLGISVGVPILGIPLSVVAAGGLIRTAIVGKRYQRLGVPFPVGEKVTEFLLSSAIVVGAIWVGVGTLVAMGCIGGMAAASLEQLRRSGGPSDVWQALSAALAVVYVCLAIGVPLGSTVWVFWITRPR